MMNQYEMYEITLQGPEPTGSQVQIDLEMTIRCGDEEWKKVKGFYAGDGVYRVRFLPQKPGNYHWVVTGSLHASGEEVCEPARAGKRGVVRVKDLHFQYEDGTWYRPFGTTVYALMHQDKALIDTTMETLSHAAFNKIRFCLFPKHYDFNHNEPDFYPFEKTDGKWDVHRPCFAFWEAFEERIRQLAEMGIEGDLILFHPYDRWGFSQFSRQDALVYLEYLLRRFSAFPNLWWSLANEFDLMEKYTGADWDAFARFIVRNDPYRHLLSNHNCFEYADFTKPELTHCCIQDINVNEVPELHRQFGKPVVFDECRYEGNIMHNWGNISAREMVHRFWSATVYGGYCTHGETYYSEDEVLWWSRGGRLKGESPARIAFLRDIVETFPGPLTYIGDGCGRFTIEQIEQMKRDGIPEELKDDFFAKGLIRMPKERLLAFMLRNRPALACCEDEAFLRYYEKECPSVGEMMLPETGKYRVEVIDTWEMTRTVVAEGVSGTVRTALPGREGIALLAVKTES